MTQKHQIQLFEEKKVRTIWDNEQEKWYFSIVDVCGVLTDSDYQAARKYWKVLKGRLKKEGNETVTNCYQLKMKAPDDKMRSADVADTEQLFRLVQSIPSKKAEAGLPAPEYKQNEFMVYATIRQAKDVVTTEKTTEKTAEKTTEKILSLILENPNITTEELARVCDMTPDGVYYHTKRLREKGVLIREDGRKEGHWVVVKKS